jgi:uncharacterized protein (TIGR00251 family)
MLFHEKDRESGGVEENAAVFAVRVVPRASRNEIVEVDGETLKVKVTASPRKGEANRALVNLLSKILGVRKSQIEIVSGQKARRKVVRIDGLRTRIALDRIRNR